MEVPSIENIKLVGLLAMLLEVHLECLGLAVANLNGTDRRLVCLLQSDGTVTDILAYGDMSGRSQESKTCTYHPFPSKPSKSLQGQRMPRIHTWPTVHSEHDVTGRLKPPKRTF